MTKNKKPINRFDRLTDQLIESFSKIKNIDLLTTDKTGNQLFNIVAYRISDISSYKDLVVHHFVPAVNKAIVESETQIRNSRYKSVFNITRSQLKETLHDTIRLSYVGLFHKLES